MWKKMIQTSQLLAEVSPAGLARASPLTGQSQGRRLTEEQREQKDKRWRLTMCAPRETHVREGRRSWESGSQESESWHDCDSGFGPSGTESWG